MPLDTAEISVPKAMLRAWRDTEGLKDAGATRASSGGNRSYGPPVNRSCVRHKNPVLRVERGRGFAVVVSLVEFPLLLFSRIVSRINEGNTSRASEVNLEDYLLVRCPGTMNVICRKHEY